MGSSSLSGYVLKSQKGVPALHQEASPGLGDTGRFKLFDRILLKEPKGIPALHQEASPGSGDRFKLFDRILLKEPKRDSCSPPGGFSRIRRWVQALCQVTS